MQFGALRRLLFYEEVIAIESPIVRRGSSRHPLNYRSFRALRYLASLLLCGGTIAICSSPLRAGQPPAAPDTPAPAEEAVRAQPLPPLKPPKLQCVSAILVDAVSGQVLYQMNADVQRPMASTTKIMTALLFCESAPEDAVVTASERACSVAESSLHLKKGEQLKAHDLLRAILMRSANDGCVAAAEYSAGSVPAFVDRMNARAAQLGATHTHFMNPHGLHDPKHYTTARDLATIARAAMQVPRIEEVVRCAKCRIERSIDKRDLTMRNHSHFLGKYPGADGVKTGWTVPAGHCYVGSATIGGWRLISVVLKSKDYVKDTSTLMSYGFRQFDAQTVARFGDALGVCPVSGGNAPTVQATVDHIVRFVTRKGEAPKVEKTLHFDKVQAPVAMGAKLGSMDVFSDGKLVATSQVVAAAPVIATSTAATVRKSPPWKGFAMTTTIFAVGLVSLRYGTRYGSRIAAIAKSARRRRRRLAQKLRSDDYRG